jgi:DnaK suppressor protein
MLTWQGKIHGNGGQGVLIVNKRCMNMGVPYPLCGGISTLWVKADAVMEIEYRISKVLQMRKDLDLEYFKNRLEKRLAELTERDASGADEPVELDQSRVGRLSRMDSMQSQAMARHGARLVEQEMNRIHAALKLMESGDYGYCIRCDEEISKGRLEFDPSLMICVECAE